MTKKRYHEDPYLTEFKGKVVEKFNLNGEFAIVLDNSCFYPTSGGQPNDLGTIQDIPVIDVVEDGEKIIHLAKKEIPGQCGDSIIGKINWGRRFDHMQQHTGQHILSAAFEKLWDAETVSFNLGDEICSIDIIKDAISVEEVKKVEELANDIVLKSMPIEVFLVNAQEAEKLNLRKLPPQKEDIRIVQIENYDICACCGTHCKNTGEVGLIKILKWEKRGMKMRIDFLCGKRSLKDYFWKNELLRNISNHLTVKDSELGEVVERMLEERKEARKKIREYEEKLQEYEAEKLMNESILIKNGKKIIRKIFEEKSVQEIKGLVQKLIEMEENIVVLTGIKNREEGAKLLLACSKTLKYDMNKLVKEVGKMIEGRGGGAPNFAQAGGKRIEGVSEALDFAVENLDSFLKKP